MQAQVPQMETMPKDKEGPVFSAPWEAKAFAVAVKMSEQGYFTWQEWVDVFSAEIIRAEAQEEFDPDHDDGSEYYHIWLVALEKILFVKKLMRHEELDARHQYLIDNPVPHEHVAHRQPIRVA